MPLGVCVQNIVGPLSPVNAVQVHFFTTDDFVCEVKQYLHAATWSSNGPSDCSVNALVFVFCNVRAPTEARRNAARTTRAMVAVWLLAFGRHQSGQCGP